MKTCIICNTRKSEDEFNIEHIIPEALGNKKLIIDLVCVECNSLLGRKVDSEIANNYLIAFQRNRFSNSGKTGKIPDPLAKGETEDGLPVKKAGENSYQTPIIATHDGDTIKIEFMATNDNVEKSSQEALGKVETILKRHHGKSLSSEEKQDFLNRFITGSETIENPKFIFPFTMNMTTPKYAFLKIAYESLFVNNEFIEDSGLLAYGNLLYNYIKAPDDEDFTDKISGIVNDDSNLTGKLIGIIKSIETVIGHTSPHYLYIRPMEKENKTVVFVSLYATELFSRFIEFDNVLVKEYKHLIVNPVSGEVL